MTPSRCLNPFGRNGKCSFAVTVINKNVIDMLINLKITKNNGRYICGNCKIIILQESRKENAIPQSKDAEKTDENIDGEKIEKKEELPAIIDRTNLKNKSEAKHKVKNKDVQMENVDENHGIGRVHNLRNKKQRIQ